MEEKEKQYKNTFYKGMIKKREALTIRSVDNIGVYTALLHEYIERRSISQIKTRHETVIETKQETAEDGKAGLQSTDTNITKIIKGT